MRMVSGRAAERLVRKLENRGNTGLAKVEKQVRRIVDDVRKKGDRALRPYAERWDGLAAEQPFRVSEDELNEAWSQANDDLKQSLKVAAENIKKYSEWQVAHAWRKALPDDAQLGQIVRPLHAVGCYVPGGRYPLPSTVLMTVIPAQVAGVKQIRVVSPHPAPETLAAARFLGVREFYRIGGAQAIAALAYGTKSVPRVDKIVGPGNLFVTAAKKMVAFDCGIDFLAGPTEVVIVSEQGEPAFIASDLVAQAEHDPDACSLLITTSEPLAKAVARECQRMSEQNTIAGKSLRKNGGIIIADSAEQAFQFANRIAPEHITVAEDALDRIENAGSVFIGDYSPQAAGDYASGPNHVLPTGGGARCRGGLSVLDFVKVVSVQRLSRSSLEKIAPAIITLAEAEGLKAHAESIRVRCAGA